MNPADGQAGTDVVVADYDALRQGVGAHELTRDVVVVSGPDAFAYLQGQLSQDLAPLDVGESVPSLVLEPDGKLGALVRVTRTGDATFALDVDGGFGETVAGRLRRFRLRTKADIDPVTWCCVALRGARVPSAETFPSEGGSVEGPWVLPVEWNGTSGVDLLGPGAARLVPGGARQCGAPAWEALRIEAGIPVMGAELDETVIPAEANLVDRTVSFTKGCYTGQELVARLDARGSRVARRLCGIVLGPAWDHDSALVAATLWGVGGDKAVGRCTSAAWCPGLGTVAGLAYLHRSVEVPGDVEWSPVRGGPTTGERRRARAMPLPLVGG